MTDPRGSLIRFTGILREDLKFVHLPAWETDYVFERPDEGDGTYVVDLLDGGDRLLTRASPVVGWRAPTPPDGGGLRLANILVYLPTHPEARLLVFRRLEPSLAEIFRAEVSEQVPVIGDITADEDRAPGRGSSEVDGHSRPAGDVERLPRPGGRACSALGHGAREVHFRHRPEVPPRAGWSRSDLDD